MPYDPAELSIFTHLFASVAEEMGVTLGRTAYSPNIKERRDYSCALFDPQGRLAAQAAHIPVHLGAMPHAVRVALERCTFGPGDLVIFNDPYLGGTHLPDITIVSPVYREPAGGDLLGYLASRAHHADVGGISAGSMPIATELYQEGLIIPPVKIAEAGQLQEGILELICRNVRTPRERRGDLAAQMAAHRTGEERLRDITSRYGVASTLAAMEALMDYAETMTRDAIRGIPQGSYSFQDRLDDSGSTWLTTSGPDTPPVPLQVTVHVEDDTLTCDFTGSAPEQLGSVNAVLAVTQSAVYYVVRCLLEEHIPSNDGCFRPVRVIAPEGSVLNPRPPRAVAAGNVETSQRIVDLVLGALAQALPHLIPAASQGTMNNVTIGGYDPERGRPFAYYETIAGGVGAGPLGPGLSGVHTHMTNTMNTPVEALEFAYPFRVLAYGLRSGSGGKGRHPGGEGIQRTWEFLVPSTVTLLTERRHTPPWGLAGGEPGALGRNLRFRQDGAQEELPPKATFRALPGERLTLLTPGGGGWGQL